MSLHDSGNDTLDTGELKELAVALSKATKSVAIVTSVLDSDVFELLLYHRGKQIDAVLSDTAAGADGLTVLEGKKRARAWAKAFQDRDFFQAVAQGNTVGFRPEAQIASYARAQESAAAMESPFAEGMLGAWCAATGLSADAPCLTWRECVDSPNRTVTPLTFVAGRPKPSALEATSSASAEQPSGGVKLANCHDEDDGPASCVLSGGVAAPREQRQHGALVRDQLRRRLSWLAHQVARRAVR